MDKSGILFCFKYLYPPKGWGPGAVRRRPVLGTKGANAPGLWITMGLSCNPAQVYPQAGFFAVSWQKRLETLVGQAKAAIEK